jgi:hypothetical protein
MQVLTGHAKMIPLVLMLKSNVPVNSLFDCIKEQNLMKVEMLSKTMTESHAQVAQKATRGRKAAIRNQKDKTKLPSPKFQVGDYVPVAENRRSGTSKLQVK